MTLPQFEIWLKELIAKEKPIPKKGFKSSFSSLLYV